MKIIFANLAENNEVEEIKFKKSKEYAVTSLSINQEVELDLAPWLIWTPKML